MPFISFSCLIVWATNPGTLFNKTGESRHPFFVPKAFTQSFINKYNINCRFFVGTLPNLMKFSFIPIFPESLYQE